MEGIHSMTTTTIIIVICCSGSLISCLGVWCGFGVGDGSWLGFCELKGDMVADILLALAPPSLPSHVIHFHCGCCCIQHATLPSDFVVQRVLLMCCKVVIMRWAGAHLV